MKVTVERVHGGRPMRTRYELPFPLEHEAFVFVIQTRYGLTPFAPPAVGKWLMIEPASPAFDAR